MDLEGNEAGWQTLKNKSSELLTFLNNKRKNSMLKHDWLKYKFSVKNSPATFDTEGGGRSLGIVGTA